MIIREKYGVQVTIYFPMVKRAVVDFAVSADWTPASGDTKISKDGGAAATTTNQPAATAMGNTALWSLTLTATEMQAARIVVTIADSATKAVEDQMLIIHTFGNASAQLPPDLSDSVRMGLTALPNAAAGANTGLPVVGTQIPNATANATGGLAALITRGATAQAGAAGTITLDASASATDDFYNGQFVYIVSGTGAGQARLIVDYVGSTKVATIAPSWATNPGAASVFAIIPSLSGHNFDTTALANFKAMFDGTGYAGGTTRLQTDARIRKNTAYSNFCFQMINSTDYVTPQTGLTVTGTVSKDGGAFGALTNAISEIGNGWYKVNLAAADVNADAVILKFTATGALQTGFFVVPQS